MIILPHRRRGTAAIPPPPSSNLQNWWTFRDPEDVTLNGGNISDVVDRQAHKDLVEATAAEQPLHITSGINAKPTSHFIEDGDLDILTTVSAWSSMSHPYVLAGVIQFTNAASATPILVATGGSEVGIDASNFYMGESGTFITGSASADTNVHYFVAKFNTSSSEFRLDGSSDASGNAGSSTTTGMQLGGIGNIGANPAQIKMSAILVYTADVTGGDLTTLESYLSNYSGV